MSIESIEKEIEQYAGRLGKPMTDKQEYIERMRAKEEAYADQKPHGPSLATDAMTRIEELTKNIDTFSGLLQERIEALEADTIRHLRRIEALEIGQHNQPEKQPEGVLTGTSVLTPEIASKFREAAYGIEDCLKKLFDVRENGAVKEAFSELERAYKKAKLNMGPGPEGPKPLTLEECVDWIWNHTNYAEWPISWTASHHGSTISGGEYLRSVRNVNPTKDWADSRILATRKALGK
jgi:hypothetical protein